MGSPAPIRSAPEKTPVVASFSAKMRKKARRVDPHDIPDDAKWKPSGKEEAVPMSKVCCTAKFLSNCERLSRVVVLLLAGMYFAFLVATDMRHIQSSAAAAGPTSGHFLMLA